MFDANRMIEKEGGIPGVSRVPLQRRRTRGLLAFIFFFLAFGTSMFVATQFTTHELHYRHLGVGPSFFWLKDVHEPFDWVIWWWTFEPHNAWEKAKFADVFLKSAGITVIGGGLLLLVLTPLTRFRFVQPVLGNAEFADDREIRKYGFVGGKGFLLGKKMMRDVVPPRIEFIRYNGDAHPMFVMNTGAGKDRCIIRPHSLSDASADRTQVVHDPAGESWLALSGARRQELGNYVLCHAWGRDPDLYPYIAPWNPFLEIPVGTKRDSLIASLLGHRFIDLSGEGVRGKNGYFYGSAINVAELASMCCAYGQREGLRLSGSGILELVYGDGFAKFLEFAEGFDHSNNGEFSWRLPNGQQSRKHPMITRLAQMCREIKDDELGSILNTFNQGYALFTKEIVQRNTETSAHSVQRIMDYDHPVFACVIVDPTDDDPLRALYTVYYELLLAFNQSSEFIEMDGNGQTRCTHKYGLDLLLNEAYSLGKVPAIHRGITTARKYNIRIVPFYQQAGQSTEQYGQKNNIDGLTKVKVFSTVADDSAERFIKLQGSQTIAYDTTSESGGKTSYNEHVNSSPLVKIEHLAALPIDKLYVQPTDGMKPFIVDKCNYDDVPEMHRRSMIPPPRVSDRLSTEIVRIGSVDREAEREEALRAQFTASELGAVDTSRGPAVPV